MTEDTSQEDFATRLVRAAAETAGMSDEELSSLDNVIVASEQSDVPLTPRQAAFVREYLKDFNGSAAAIRAGYSAGGSRQIASRLLTYPNIKAALQTAEEQQRERLIITKEKVLNEMSALANSNVAHYVITDDGQVTLAPGAPSNAMSAIQSIKKKTTVRWEGKGDDAMPVTTYDVELKLWDKPTPLKLMGKHVGIFADKVEHTGKDGAPIEMVTRVERVIVDPVVKE